MAVQTSQGCKFYIGPQNTTASDTTAYDALTFTEIGEIQNPGAFGDTFNAVNFTALSDGRVRKFKGSVDGGELNLTVALDPSDAGQDAARAALAVTTASGWEYAFKVTLNDSAGTNPTTYYFRGLVMSGTTEIGEADSIVMSTINISINSPQVEKAAA